MKKSLAFLMVFCLMFGCATVRDNSIPGPPNSQPPVERVSFFKSVDDKICKWMADNDIKIVIIR